MKIKSDTPLVYFAVFAFLSSICIYLGIMSAISVFLFIGIFWSFASLIFLVRYAVKLAIELLKEVK